MVALSIEFIERRDLMNYQIESIVCNRKNYRMEVKLTNYFSNMPDLRASVRYFELLNDSIVMVHPTDIMYRITTDAQDYFEKLIEMMADDIRSNMEGGSEYDSRDKNLLVSGPL